MRRKTWRAAGLLALNVLVESRRRSEKIACQGASTVSMKVYVREGSRV
jgi:hypothetical protein